MGCNIFVNINVHGCCTVYVCGCGCGCGCRCMYMENVYSTLALGKEREIERRDSLNPLYPIVPFGAFP